MNHGNPKRPDGGDRWDSDSARGIILLGMPGSSIAKLRTIHEAAANGSLTDVIKHLQRGADVNAKDANGATPLLSAAMNGRKEVAELLVAKGADVEARTGMDGRPSMGP